MYQKFFKFLQKIRPQPFKKIQIYFDIEQEWKTLKNLIYLNSKNYFLFSLIITSPFTVYPLKNIFQSFLTNQLKQDEPISNATEIFAKQIVKQVLRDKQIEKDGAQFVENLAKRDQVINAVLNILIQSVKDKDFIENTKISLQDVTQKIIKNDEVQKDLVYLLSQVIKDDDIKFEIKQLTKDIIKDKEIQNSLVELLSNSFQDQKVIDALRQTLTIAFYDLLNNKETAEKLKLFIYYLAENQPESQSKIKILIDQWTKSYFDDIEIDSIFNLTEKEKKKKKYYFF